jgi:hypothetical protein
MSKPPAVMMSDDGDQDRLRLELEAMSDADLLRALQQALREMGRGLRRLAQMVRVLEERGVDLSDLKIGLLAQLRRIAHGQLHPEVVSHFGESKQLIKVVGTLPMPDQERLAGGAPVKLMILLPDGRTDHRFVDPIHLNRREVNQVFDQSRHCLRDDAGQVAWLQREKAEASRPMPTKIGCMVVDVEGQRVLVGNRTITKADLKAALRALGG